MASRSATRGRRAGVIHPQAANQPGGQGPQGTLGGTVRNAVGTRPGRVQLKWGDEVYLWILVGLEILAITWGRKFFKRTHGG